MKSIDYVSASRGNLLSELISSEYGGVAKFCQDTGEDYGAIHKYVNGALRIGDKVARRLEGFFKVNAGYLDKNIPNKLLTNVPVVSIDEAKSINFKLEQNEASENILLENGLVKAYAWKTESLMALVANNDSMEPTIFEGDYVVIDCAQKNIIPNKVYALSVHGDFYIRRLDKSIETGGLILIADSNLYNLNNKYKSIELKHDNFHIIGRVVYVPRVL